MIAPFEISERFREIDERSIDIIDELTKDMHETIVKYENLGFEFLRFERDESTRETSFVFRFLGVNNEL